MTQILNYNYMNFRRYLKRRDEVGDTKAIAEFKREQAEGILDHMVSAGPHQQTITSSDCVVISRHIDSLPEGPTPIVWRELECGVLDKPLELLNGPVLEFFDTFPDLYIEGVKDPE